MPNKNLPLDGKIALVTGGSRGLGRGIALQLSEAGATVYISGRRPENSDSDKASGLPTLAQTALDVTARGGEGIPVSCDHSSTTETEALFERIAREQDGKLDILVNNAFGGINALADNWEKKFYEQDLSVWDSFNDVGLKNYYVCSVLATRMMVKKGNGGLIVMMSSIGGLQYLFNVPYGVGKTGVTFYSTPAADVKIIVNVKITLAIKVDRMVRDMGYEMKKGNITYVSLWPGPVRSELFQQRMESDEPANGYEITKERMNRMVQEGESTEYSGKCIVDLAKDETRARKNGQTMLTVDIGHEYGFRDIDGRTPPSMRSLSTIFNWFGMEKIASWTPGCFKLPYCLLSMQSSNFGYAWDDSFLSPLIKKFQ